MREALRVLTAEGLVTTRRGVSGGTFVVTPDRDAINRSLETSLGLLVGVGRPGIENLLEARALLERPAAALAAIRHNDQQLDTIASMVSDDAVHNVEMYQSKFHIAILEASGNVMLEVMTRPLFAVLRTRLVRSAAPGDFWGCVVEDHRKILTAIAERDEEGASQAMGDHLTQLSAVYRDIDSALHPDLGSGSQPKLVRGKEGK